MKYNTKEKLFQAATRLFAENGYNSVSMREIAAAVGITEAAIYRHYEKKEAILNEIFAEFERKLKSYVLTKNQVDNFIKTDTTRQLLERCIGRFTEEDTPFMASAYRIVYKEQLTNPSAMEIVVSQLHDATAESIRYALDSLIELEKIPAFDTWFYSTVWTQCMFSGAVLWISAYCNGKTEEFSSASYNAISEGLVNMAMSAEIP